MGLMLFTRTVYYKDLVIIKTVLLVRSYASTFVTCLYGYRFSIDGHCTLIDMLLRALVCIGAWVAFP